MSHPATKPKKASSKARTTYHHGDLRRALLDAAQQLIGAHGMEALTLREVARKVGVTHAAPYHHFPTREALLDALAEESFALLDEQMRATLARSDDEPAARLAAIGAAYIDFARAHPERHQVMFRRRTQKHRDERGDEVQGASFMHLFDAVTACQEAGLAPAGDPHALALSAWSLVHGFAALWIEGPLADMEAYAAPYEQLRDALLADFIASWRALAHSARGERR